MQSLSIAGKITVFKTFIISKIVHLALLKVIPILTILEIKQNILCKDAENGGLKNVDITFKIASLRCSWVKWLYDSTHDWKLKPLHIITQKLEKHFLLHSSLYIDPKNCRQFPI